MPAGRGANAAYWWDTKSGAFVSSTYYMPEMPAWAKAFNDRKLADARAGRGVDSHSPVPRFHSMPSERTEQAV